MTTALNPYEDCCLILSTIYVPNGPEYIQQLVQEIAAPSQFHHIIICKENPSETLKDMKHNPPRHPKTNKPLKFILMVQGEFGHDVIRYLCDDYDAVPASARRVLWIHSLPVGLDFYQFPLLLNEVQDTLITNGRGSQSMPLAEYVFYSFFYFNRQTTRQLRQKAEREWSPYNIQPLQGSTLCIFGYGDIGQCVARLALAFGMKVIALRRRKNNNENNHNEVQMVSPQSAEELYSVLGSADYIVNILPHTAETDRYFDKEKFSAMKSSALYVNIGRGRTQVEYDLCECLREGKLRGASLDVYEEEPLPSESPLWSLPDDLILLNPHAAAWHEKQLYNLCQRFVFLCEEWKKGAAMEGHSVNRELWY